MPRPSSPKVSQPTDPEIETILSSACGREFQRTALRGRKPLHCPECRTTLPDDASIGAAPPSMANATSERSRPACDQAVSNWVAQITPMPGSASSRGASRPTSVSSSAWRSSASAWRASTRRAVRRSAMIVARCSIGWVGWLRRPAHRASSWSVASVRSWSRSGAGVDDQRFQVVDRAPPRLHGAVAGGQQHAHGLPIATPTWLGQVVAAQRLVGRSNGVQVIGLGAVAARWAGRTVDPDHPFALLEQAGGEAGPVAAGASIAQTRRCGARSTANR
jgi:hypothetical protein